jgi:hypothetical protein
VTEGQVGQDTGQHGDDQHWGKLLEFTHRTQLTNHVTETTENKHITAHSHNTVFNLLETPQWEKGNLNPRLLGPSGNKGTFLDF